MASPRSVLSTDTMDSPVHEALPFDYGDTPILDSSYGQMTITLVPNGTALPVPVVTFSPIGHFTARLVEHYLPLIGQEIQRAQAKVRHEQNYGPAKDAA